MRLLPTLLLSASLLLPHTVGATPPALNSLTSLHVGRTTLRQAEQLWQAQHAVLQSQRYGNALESFSNGLNREVSNLHVVVSDIQQPDHITQTRLWFFDGVLYRLNVRFASSNRYDELVPYLSQQYGTPLSQIAEPRQSYWQLGDVWASLQAGDDGKVVLQLEHRLLARQVRTSNIEVYAAYVVAKPAGRSIVSP